MIRIGALLNPGNALLLIVAFSLRRPLWIEFPQDVKTLDMDDQFLVGREILVKPVTSKDQAVTSVYLPAGEVSTPLENSPCPFSLRSLTKER
jgi:hypothetical protein